MHVRGVAGHQHPAAAVGDRLPRPVGEPGEPADAAQPVVRAVHPDERLAELVHARVAGVVDLPLREHDPDRPVGLPPAEGVGAGGVATEAELRLLVELDLGDHPAGRGVRADEVDAGLPPDQAAAAVAADEVLRSQRRAVGHLHVDAGVVLGEACHLAAAENRYAELGDPVREDRLEVALPQREAVGVAGREVADVQPDAGEPLHLHDLPRRQEPVGDAPLVEHLDGARVQTAGPRPVDRLVGAPLHHRDVDPRERQLARQHQAGRPTAGDHHRVVRHRSSPTMRRG